MQLVKGDLLRIIGPIQLYFGPVVYFEKFFDRTSVLRRGCDISLYSAAVPFNKGKQLASITDADLFVFGHEYFPIGSKE